MAARRRQESYGCVSTSSSFSSLFLLGLPELLLEVRSAVCPVGCFCIWAVTVVQSTNMSAGGLCTEFLSSQNGSYVATPSLFPSLHPFSHPSHQHPLFAGSLWLCWVLTSLATLGTYLTGHSPLQSLEETVLLAHTLGMK